MQEVDRQGEVRDEFGARDQEKERDHSARIVSDILPYLSRGAWRTYVVNPFTTHRNPTVQPSVLSPLTLLQSSTKSGVNFCPRTKVVKTININAVV